MAKSSATWTKGQSGNPNGRPPKGKTVTEALIVAMGTPTTDGQDLRILIAAKLISLAESGDLGAIKYIFDRLDGRPTESHELSGEVGLTVVKLVPFGPKAPALDEE